MIDLQMFKVNMACVEKRQGMPRLRWLSACACLLATGFSAAQVPSTQLPSGGRVVGGSATLSTSGSNLTVVQGTPRAAVEWQNFNVGSAATVNFVQPDSRSVVLNKVLGGTPSQIYGSILANGQVYLVNPQGVYFSPTARVNVGSLVASTLDLDPSSFMAGSTLFSAPGSNGSVRNDGTIEVGSGGYAALLGTNVTNNGLIKARAGMVALASGEAVSLDINASGGLLGVAVTPASVQTLVENRHLIQAPDGAVIMTSQAANQLLGSVVNTGTVSANQLATDGAGRIVMKASSQISNTGNVEAMAASGTGGAITMVAPSVDVSGKLDVSGAVAGGQVVLQSPEASQGSASAGRVRVSDASLLAGSSAGRAGSITVASDRIDVVNTTLDASGASGGGLIAVGGSALGITGVYEATRLNIGQDVVIRANAKVQGDGGTVVLRTDPTRLNTVATIGASIEAQGAGTGRGGQVDTSGYEVNLAGIRVLAGYWIVDPYDLTINTALATSINSALATSDVTIATGTSSNDKYTGTGITSYSTPSCSGVSCPNVLGTNTGKITVSSPITWSSSHTLKIVAYGDLVVNQSIQGDDAGGLLLSSLTGDVTIKPNVAGTAGSPKIVFAGTRLGTTDVYAARDVNLRAFNNSQSSQYAGGVIGYKLNASDVSNTINVYAGRDINMNPGDGYDQQTLIMIGNGTSDVLTSTFNVQGTITVNAARDINMRGFNYYDYIKIGNGAGIFYGANTLQLGTISGDVSVRFGRHLVMLAGTGMGGAIYVGVHIGNGYSVRNFQSTGAVSGNITIAQTAQSSADNTSGLYSGFIGSLASGSIYMDNTGSGSYYVNQIGNGGGASAYNQGAYGALSGNININISGDLKINGNCTVGSCNPGANSPYLVIGNSVVHYGGGSVLTSSSNTGSLTLSVNQINITGGLYNPPIGSQDFIYCCGSLSNATGTTTYSVTIANPIAYSASVGYNFTVGSYTGSILNVATPFDITKVIPVMSWGNGTTMTLTYGDQASVSNTATSSSGGQITYSSSNASVLSFSSSTSPVATINTGGVVTVTATSAATSTYNMGTLMYSVTINKKTVTLAASKPYDGTATFAASTFTAGGLVGSDAAPTLGGSVTGITNVADSGASAAITGLTITSSKYQLPATATFSVTPVSPNLSFTNATPTATYGDGTFTQQATTASSGAITYSSANTGVLSFASSSSATGTVLAAGAASVTANIVAAGNYTSGTATYTLTVNKKTLTLTASKPYDGNGTFALSTFTVGGVVGGDAAPVIGGTAQTTTVVNVADAGSRSISGLSISSSNYQLPTTASFSVQGITPNLIFADASPAAITYGAGTFSNAASASNSSGAITYSSSNAGVLNFSTASSATGAVAGAGAVVVTAHLAADGNVAAGTATYSLTVNKKVVTLSASKPFDGTGTFMANTFTASGLVGSDAQPTLGGSVNTGVVNVADSGASAATTGLTITSSNYLLPSTATFSVTPVSPNLSFANASPTATYGDGTFTQSANTLSSGAITYSSGNSGVLTFASASSATGDVLAAGSATVTASISAAGNYSAGNASYTLAVGKKTLTLTASKPYDGNGTFALNTFTVGGLVGSDAAPVLGGVSQSTTVVNVADAGTRSLSGLTLSSANYQLPTSAAFGVTPVAPQLSFASTSPAAITYGDGTFSNQASSSNSAGTISYSSNNASVLNFGSVSLPTAQVTGAGGATVTAHILASGNYTAGSANYTLTVNKKALSLTASKPYDGNDGFAADKFVVSGLVGQDAAPVLSGSVASTGVVSVAQSGGSAGVSGLTLSSANYQLPSSAIYSVTPAVLTATLTGSVSKIYDGSRDMGGLTSGNFAFTGFAPGESATVTRTTGQLVSKDVGTSVSLGTALIASDFVPGSSTVIANYVWPTSANGAIANVSRLNSVTWTGGASGLWSDPANWTAVINGRTVIGAIPDKANVANVYIPSGSTVIFDASVATLNGQVQVDRILGAAGSTSSVGSLTLSGGYLRSSAEVVLNNYSQTGGQLDVGGNLSVLNTLTASGGVLTTVGDLSTVDFSMSGTGTQVNVGGNFTTSRSLTVTDGMLSVVGRSDITATGQDLNFSDSHFSFGGPVSVSAASLTTSLSSLTLDNVNLSTGLTVTGGQVNTGDLTLPNLTITGGRLNSSGSITANTLTASGGVLTTVGNLRAVDFSMSGTGTQVNVGGNFTTSRSLTVTDGMLSVVGRSDITATGQDLNFSDSHFSFGGPVSVSAASLTNGMTHVTLDEVALTSPTRATTSAVFVPATPTTAISASQVLSQTLERSAGTNDVFSKSQPEASEGKDEQQKSGKWFKNVSPVINMDCIGDSGCKSSSD